VSRIDIPSDIARGNKGPPCLPPMSSAAWKARNRKSFIANTARVWPNRNIKDEFSGAKPRNSRSTKVSSRTTAAG
jgi:hypothetical protein